MRVVFMGTPEFAVPSLLAMTTRHDVLAVYTRPDSVSGRGSHRRPSAGGRGRRRPRPPRSQARDTQG